MYATYGIPTIKKSCPISDVSYRFYRCYHTKLAFQHHNLKTDIQVEIISVRPCTLRGLNERPSLRLVMVPMVKALHENYLTVISHISIRNSRIGPGARPVEDEQNLRPGPTQNLRPRIGLRQAKILKPRTGPGILVQDEQKLLIFETDRTRAKNRNSRIHLD